MYPNNLIKAYEASFREHFRQPALSDYATGYTISYRDLALQIAHLHYIYIRRPAYSAATASL